MEISEDPWPDDLHWEDWERKHADRPWQRIKRAAAHNAIFLGLIGFWGVILAVVAWAAS